MRNRSQDFWRTPKLATIAIITFVFTGALAAQDMRAPRIAHPPRVKSGGSTGPAVQSQRAVPSIAPAALNDTTWTNIGPAPVSADPTSEATPDSGRINGIAAHPTDPNIIYVAASGGGVWKTINGGTHWTPLTDTQKTLAMGAIAIAPSNPNVLYAGTGEPNGQGNYGLGVLVSTNGGTTWTLENNGGTFDRREISEIAVDPNNAKVAYVATTSCCATNTNFNDDGVYKTTDGGATWTNTTINITPLSDGWSSIKIDSSKPSTLYAAAGYARGSADNGVYKSTDSGSIWKKLTDAKLPSGKASGVIKVAVSKSNSQVIYVSAATPNGSLYKFLRSDNGGATFTDLTTGTPNYMGDQGNFDTTLIVDPKNPAIVYAAGSSGTNTVLRSTDSGAHWTDLHGTSGNGANGPHVDHHASAFDANGRFLDGDDGGIFRYDPAAKPNSTWTSLNGNLSTILFEGLGINPSNPNLAVGGSQDNAVLRYSGSLDWAEVFCGDGGKVRFSRQDTSRVYAQCPGSIFQRSDDGGLTWAIKTEGITDGGNDQNFYAPFAVDPNDGNRVIFGARHAFETTNGGETWAQLGTFTFPATIDAIDVSASHPNTIYASAGGKTFITTDKGVIWTQRDLPVTNSVSDLKVFPGHNLSAVAVIANFTTGGNVFHTTDGGKTWIDITGNLPTLSGVGTLPVWSVQFHGNSINTIYVGNDDGVYKTTDRGATWFRFGAGLPNVQVFDIQLDTKLGILAAGTFGRGAWEIKLPPPTTTTVSAVSGRPGESITLKADVKPAAVPGAIRFFVNGAAIPGKATYDSATGRAEQPYIIPNNLAVGKHVITADFTSSNEAIGGNSAGVNELTVR